MPCPNSSVTLPPSWNSITRDYPRRPFHRFLCIAFSKLPFRISTMRMSVARSLNAIPMHLNKTWPFSWEGVTCVNMHSVAKKLCCPIRVTMLSFEAGAIRNSYVHLQCLPRRWISITCIGKHGFGKTLIATNVSTFRFPLM